MNKSSELVNSLYGNKIRVRVCGLHFQGNKVLLVRHRGLGPEGVFWAPPGGGIEFGESFSAGLRREIKEETSLDVSDEDFLFIHEFIQEQLHAVELFFRIEIAKGRPAIGVDPEHSLQIIEHVKYFSEEEIYQSNLKLFHQIFHLSGSFAELLSLKGCQKG